MMLHRRTALTVAVLLAGSLAPAAEASEIRPGVWAASTAEALPLPTQGYEVYLVGELHGIQENIDFQVQYLALLQRTSGLRDIAIEERGVYEQDAQAYVDGRSDALPPKLCLRAAMLDGIRRLNARLPEQERIRVHLTDIDSPAFAIRAHLLALQNRLGAPRISIPDESSIRAHGLEAVAQMKALTPDSTTRSELRTVELSIVSLQQGLEFDLGPSKGVPYLDSRENAVASNIADLLRLRGVRSLLVVYGSDHASRVERKNFAGPQKDQRYTPTALRLEQAGLRVFTIISAPLDGQPFWRGRKVPLFWTPADAQLSSGETLDKVLAAAPTAGYLYIDAKRERARMPGEDLNHMAPDAFLLFRSGTPISERCAVVADRR
jgi:hypothetical protein